ncbi:MAG: glycosyltransferase family 4 protein, partial [Clostridia bacterium]
MSRLVWAFGRHVNGTVENLANVFEANGYTIARCDVEVPRWRKLSAMLRTLHVDSQGHLAGFSAHDPVVVQAVRLPAHLADLPVLSVRDVILNESPHFFYQDLSYSTVLAQRNAGIRTFTYDDIPL